MAWVLRRGTLLKKDHALLVVILICSTTPSPPPSPPLQSAWILDRLALLATQSEVRVRESKWMLKDGAGGGVDWSQLRRQQKSEGLFQCDLPPPYRTLAPRSIQSARVPWTVVWIGPPHPLNRKQKWAHTGSKYTHSFVGKRWWGANSDEGTDTMVLYILIP